MKSKTLYGICNLSVVPCRKEPSSKSEMVSQLLFGEHVEITDEKGEWYYIKNSYDNYVSWVNKLQLEIIPEATYKKINSQLNCYYSKDLIAAVSYNSLKNSFPIVIGSSLPFLKEKETTVGSQKYLYSGATCEGIKAKNSSIIKTAFQFLNSPYLWGGRTPLGIDCSGFTQAVYKLNGIKLQRDAYQQAEQGNALSFLEEAEPGDLAFFDNKEGKIIHVGIVLENLQIIHASGKVRIDKIDHQGIYNTELNEYTHNLRIIKKII